MNRPYLLKTRNSINTTLSLCSRISPNPAPKKWLATSWDCFGSFLDTSTISSHWNSQQYQGSSARRKGACRMLYVTIFVRCSQNTSFCAEWRQQKGCKCTQSKCWWIHICVFPVPAKRIKTWLHLTSGLNIHLVVYFLVIVALAVDQNIDWPTHAQTQTNCITF